MTPETTHAQKLTKTDACPNRRHRCRRRVRSRVDTRFVFPCFNTRETGHKYNANRVTQTGKKVPLTMTCKSWNVLRAAGYGSTMATRLYWMLNHDANMFIRTQTARTVTRECRTTQV